MANPFDNAISALTSYQRALTTVSHNISNVNTPGYSRQEAQFKAREPDGTGGTFIGNGVEIGDIRRVADKYIDARLRDANSDVAYADAFQGVASQLDKTLGDSSTGLIPALTDYFSAVQTVANDPGSLPARRVFMESAKSLVQRFDFMDQRVQGLEAEVNNRLRVGVSDVNSTLDALGSLNSQIAAVAQRGAGSSPNDFIDTRDQLLQDLSRKIAIHVVEIDDGSVSVFTKEGQPLLVGQLANHLGIVQNEFDPRRLEISLDVGSNPPNITDKLSGGELGGLIEFRAQVLDDAHIKLGRVATVMAQSMNDQHRKGMDLTGALGGDLFDVAGVQVLASSENAAATTTAPTVTISDVTALESSNYEVSYDGTTASWTLTQLSDGTTTALDATVETAPGSGIYILPNEGLQIDVSAVTATDGDDFLIRPTWRGAEQIDFAISTPQEIATAAPIRSRSSSTNIGTGTISAGVVLDETDASLLTTVNIVFEDPPTTYILQDSTGTQINDPVTGLPTSYTYTSGSDIEFFGWQVSIRGTPSATDTFTIQQNNNGYGDNRNALLIGDLQNTRMMDSGQNTYQSAYGTMVGEVGAISRQKQIEKTAQKNLLDNVQTERDALAGVSLDEEAVKLMQFQQAYQASAQVITVARQLIDELMQAVRS